MRLFWEGLFALGLEEKQLPELPKGDGRKLALAAFIGERTIVQNAWLSETVHLGHVGRISRCWSDGADKYPCRQGHPFALAVPRPPISLVMLRSAPLDLHGLAQTTAFIPR